VLHPAELDPLRVAVDHADRAVVRALDVRLNDVVWDVLQ
jgi:hypothetical protein